MARIPTLDGFRAISILLVILYHSFRTRGFPSPPVLYPWLRWLGELGVRVFFVISGYLITGILLRELRDTGRIAIVRFYFRRTLRLFPAFYAFLTVVALLVAFGLIRLNPGDLRSAATYTMNYHPEPSWWLIHCWSLSVEEQFYLLWPALLMLLGGRRGLAAAVIFVLAGPFIRYTNVHLLRADLRIHDTTFGTIGDAIAMGCVLAGFRDRVGELPLYRRYVGSAAALCGPALVVVAYVADVVSWQARTSFGPSALNLGIALCLDWCLRNPGSAVGRFLDSRPMVALGVGSYSLYLWQELFLNFHHTGPLQRFPLNVACAAVVGAVSYFAIERPSLRLRARIEPRLFARGETAKNRREARTGAPAVHPDPQQQPEAQLRLPPPQL